MRNVTAVLIATALALPALAAPPAVDLAPITVTNGGPPRGHQTAADYRKCIAYWQKYIDRQKRIGEVAGVVDKHVLYVAGVQLVECQDGLAAITR